MSDTVEIGMTGLTDRLNQAEHFGRKAVWSAILAGTCVLMMFQLQPILIGGWAQAGIAESDLGLLAASDLAGATLASLLGLLWVKKFRWRPAALIALMMVMGGNLLCVGQSSFIQLFAYRLLAGLGSGTLVVLTMSIIARTSHPDRYTSFFLAGQVVAQSIAFTTMAAIVAEQGVSTLYYLFAGLAALSLPLISLFPHSSASEAFDDSGSAVTAPVGRSALVLILASMALFYVAQGALFAFSERIGAAAHLDAEGIGNALAISALFALAGAFLAGWLDTRFGRFKPIIVAGAAQLAVLVLLQGQMSLLFFTLMFGVFSFFWNMAFPYQVGVLVSHDKEMRFAALIPAVQGLGLTIGPALAGSFLGGESYLPVNLIAGIALVLYLVAILPFSRKVH